MLNSMRYHTRRRLQRRDVQNCGHQKIDVGIMTHPKLLKFVGAQKMYPRRKTVESCFILFQIVVKLFVILKIIYIFFFINKMA